VPAEGASAIAKLLALCLFNVDNRHSHPPCNWRLVFQSPSDGRPGISDAGCASIVPSMIHNRLRALRAFSDVQGERLR
jgi:hypothetical protein